MKNQLKRLAAPRTWPIARKGKERWIAKPLPGAHKQRHCIPISVALRDILKLASTTREVKRILHDNEVLVNGNRVKKVRLGIGLFDVLAINKLNQYYRVILTKRNKLAFVEIKKAEANILPLKVKSKTTLRGGKIQFNFTNGWNVLSKAKHAIGSTVLFDISKKKVGNEIKLKKGAVVAITAGKYVGQVAKLEDIKPEGKLKKRKLALLKSLGGAAVFSTLADSLFAVGATKPEFTTNGK